MAPDRTWLKALEMVRRAEESGQLEVRRLPMWDRAADECVVSIRPGLLADQRDPNAYDRAGSIERWIKDRAVHEGFDDICRLVAQIHEAVDVLRTKRPELADSPLLVDIVARIVREVAEPRDVVLASGAEGDWVGLYVDGKLRSEGHSLAESSVAEALGARVESIELKQAWLERNGLPQELGAIPREALTAEYPRAYVTLPSVSTGPSPRGERGQEEDAE